MSTDHPGRPFRYGIRFKIAVSIGVIMVALMAVDILWNLSLQNAQAENEAREKAEVLAAEMRAAWDFVDMNQEHQPCRGRHLPYEAPRVRGGGEVNIHAVHHGNRLLHPLHK